MLFAESLHFTSGEKGIREIYPWWNPFFLPKSLRPFTWSTKSISSRQGRFRIFVSPLTQQEVTGTINSKKERKMIKQSEKLRITEACLENIIVVIGRIAKALNDPKVSSVVLTPLLNRIHYPPRRVDELIIEQLLELCALGQKSGNKQKSFSDVASLWRDYCGVH